MKVSIKSMPIGWAWNLVTSDGQHFEGIALDFVAMWQRIFHLENLVIEHDVTSF